MSPVPAVDPAYCIHTWEVTFSGSMGDLDQWREGAVATEGVVASEQGVLPSVGASFSQAELACANTRAVDADGVDHGAMWLATAAEWQDAGDGVVGAGGTVYPWGDTWDASMCVTTDDDGIPVWSGTQATGSLETCRSSFGVYDQIGNVWEWVDSGVAIDVEAWFATWPEFGREEGWLTAVDSAAAHRLAIEVTGVAGEVVWADGRVRWASDLASWGTRVDLHGWAVSGVGEPDVSSLPVRAVDSGEVDADGRVLADLLVLEELNGRPYPDKRGGAWYSGTRPRLDTPSYAHSWDFNGTIGFRCASAPFPD